MAEPKKVSAPIRIDADMEKRIDEAARLTGLSKADVMRLAMRIGFEDLRKINYDLSGTISEAANPAAKVPVKYPALRPMKSSKVAENEGNGHASA